MGPSWREIAANHDAILFLRAISSRWPRPQRARPSHARTTSAAAIIADTVLLPIGVVGVAGPERVDHCRNPAALIFVANE